MSLSTFLRRYKDQIQNIDGCLDDQASITILKNGVLEFYWFDEGKCVKRKKK
jgi:hypothetical protein